VYEPGEGGRRGPLNLKALASAASYLGKAKIPPTVRKQIARKLARLYRSLGKEVPDNIKKYLGTGG